MSIKLQIPLPLFDSLQNLDENPSTLQNLIKNNSIKHMAADYKQACNFLLSYRGNEATFNAYRREVERLLQWNWLIAKKSLKELRRTDIEQFIEFCQAPAKHWIGIDHVPRFKDKNGLRIGNATWRPFVATVAKRSRNSGQNPSIKNYVLSQSALQAIFAITGSFYNYLIQEEYVNINPIAQIRQKSRFLVKRQNKKQIRRLSELQWSYVIETAELIAQADPSKHERTLFIMSALFGMYLRISELAASKRWIPQMGDFKKDADGNWWFTTVGKGNKMRDITVSDEMLACLKRYRIYLGLSPLPSAGENAPLITANRGSGPITSTRQIRKIVQDCFDKSLARMQLDGFTEDADQLMAATVHWLRHTGISEDVKHRPREHVRDDAGHSSSAITDRYIDIELRERHASARKKTIKPEFVE